MKYTVSNIIHRPLEEVMLKFQDPDGVIHWMEGLEKVKHLSGTPGEVGAESDFYFLLKGRTMVIHETILEQTLPRQIKFAYESPMGYNEVEIQFEVLDDQNVRQINNSYFELKGMMRIMGPLMKGMFKKQSLKYLDGFKAYVEK